MVSIGSSRLDLVFHALAHPARRRILKHLAERELNLSELARPLKMSFPAASKHVRVLERAKLVHRRVEGRQHICRADTQPIAEATSWLESYRAAWESRFAQLDAVLEEMKQKERQQ